MTGSSSGVCAWRVPPAFFLLSTSLSCFFTSFFFFNDTATTEIYTLSLHDALPISAAAHPARRGRRRGPPRARSTDLRLPPAPCWGPHTWSVRPARWTSGLRSTYGRSEEHTSELQSLTNLVCRLLLEKKKYNNRKQYYEQDKFTKTALGLA